MRCRARCAFRKPRRRGNMVVSAWSVRSSHRPRWMPGNGGLFADTILPDPANPERMLRRNLSWWCYRTDDGGRTWTAQNRGIRAMFVPTSTRVRACVHKMRCTLPVPNVFSFKITGLVSLDANAKTGRTLPMASVGFWFRHVIHPKNQIGLHRSRGVRPVSLRV